MFNNDKDESRTNFAYFNTSRGDNSSQGHVTCTKFTEMKVYNMAINFWKFDKDLLNNNKDESRIGLILPILTHQGEITLVRVMWPIPISQRHKFTSWPLISESLKKICSITTKMNPGQKKTDGRSNIWDLWVNPLFF